MTEDVRIKISFSGHRKRARLQAAGGPAAVLALVDLWLSLGAEGSPDGRVGDLVDLAALAKWTGDPEVLFLWLSTAGGEGRAGFVKKDEAGVIFCHDWAANNPWAADAKARSAVAAHASRTRWGCKPDARNNAGSNAGSNAPSLSLPILKSPLTPLLEKGGKPPGKMRKTWREPGHALARSYIGSQKAWDGFQGRFVEPENLSEKAKEYLAGRVKA